MTVPQITPPPLLPAPPFTSPVEVEGKLYIAQETFGAANKHMLQMMRIYLLHARMRAWAMKEAWLQQGRPGGSDCCPPQYRFLKDTCCVVVDSRHVVGESACPQPRPYSLHTHMSRRHAHCSHVSSQPVQSRSDYVTSTHRHSLKPSSSYVKSKLCDRRAQTIFSLHIPLLSSRCLKLLQPTFLHFPRVSACPSPSSDFPSSFFLLPVLPGPLALQKESFLPLFSALFRVRLI